MAQQRFDLVVVGTGTGLDVANWAAQDGWKVAIVEKGPIGGTCLNRGCIPSKLLIHSADVMETIGRAHLFGIRVKVEGVDWARIVQRVTASVDGDSQGIERGLKGIDNPKLFQGEARFVGPKRLRIGDGELVAERFLLAHGARPKIPDIPGLREVPFLTSTEALRREKQPKSLLVLGGGYIAAELAHFYGSLGTEVTIVHKHPLLLRREDGEVARAFTARYQQRFAVHLDSEVARIRQEKGEVLAEVVAKRTQKKREVRAEALLVAVGVAPNSDTLDLGKTGVVLDARGFVKVDEFLETNVPGIFALGDALGRFMFKHSANHEASYAYQNLREPGDKVPVDYHAMPHAIFAGPQVASVGRTEEECVAAGSDFVKSTYRYRDTAMGHALEEEHGFVKFLVERGTGRILGCHILGPEAATLIHEVIVAMRAGEGSIDHVTKAVHVHPALSEVVQRAAPGPGDYAKHTHAH